jgi:hypothetical protein
MASNEKHLAGLLTVVILVLLTIAMFAATWIVPNTKDGKSWNFIIVIVSMLLFVVTVGVRVSGRPAGILINERNLISLSRFQTVLWTLIILSGFLTMALLRIRFGVPSDQGPLDIALDWRLWALMGISTTSLIGTPLIQSTKKTKEPDEKVAAKTADLTGETGKAVKENAQGMLYANPKIEDAALSDMFEGDEVGDTAYVDLAKVQMFFFTIVAGLSYFVILYSWIRNRAPEDLAAFPVLSEGFIAILGISHAGFLANKSNDHTMPAKTEITVPAKIDATVPVKIETTVPAKPAATVPEKTDTTVPAKPDNPGQ